MKQVVIIFIQNDEGKFFVHQRLSSKKTFPNRFGIGAGGHVEEGEDLAAAARRELQEETGITADPNYLFSLDFDTPELQQTSHLYFVETNDEVKTDTSEWQWSGWMSKEKLNEMCGQEKLCIDTEALYKQFLQLM